MFDKLAVAGDSHRPFHGRPRRVDLLGWALCSRQLDQAVEARCWRSSMLIVFARRSGLTAGEGAARAVGKPRARCGVDADAGWIPFVSGFYRGLTGNELSCFDVVCLVAAIPAPVCVISMEIAGRWRCRSASSWLHSDRLLAASSAQAGHRCGDQSGAASWARCARLPSCLSDLRRDSTRPSLASSNNAGNNPGPLGCDCSQSAQPRPSHC